MPLGKEKKTVQSVSALVINMLQICCINWGNSLSYTQLAIHSTPIYGLVQYRASLCAGVHCIKPSRINDSFIWHLACSSPSPSRFEESYIFSFFSWLLVVKSEKITSYTFPCVTATMTFIIQFLGLASFYIGPYFLLRDEGPVELIISLHFHT